MQQVVKNKEWIILKKRPPNNFALENWTKERWENEYTDITLIIQSLKTLEVLSILPPYIFWPFLNIIHLTSLLIIWWSSFNYEFLWFWYKQIGPKN